ncbi:MAG: DUF721 domain-containing protein [Geminicoccaceae bacterium]|nr:DUF721 domain-containing protein [Geminicoccaceae bacterium]
MKASGQASRRAHAACSISRVLGSMLEPAARRRGFAEAALLGDWPTIVGARIAAQCQPERIFFRPGSKQQGVLVLRAPGAAALEVQHATPQIIERINVYLGFPAVRRITLTQDRLERRSTPPPVAPSAPVSAVVDADVARSLEGVEPGTLHDALARLGRLVKSDGGR